MASNAFDQFDAPAKSAGNAFDQFDKTAPTAQAAAVPADRPQFNRYQKFMGKGKVSSSDSGAKVLKFAVSPGYATGGAVTDIAAKHLPPEAAAAAGYAANVVAEAAPALLTGDLFKAAAPALREAGKKIMQSALKPTLQQLRTGKAAKAIQTMLDEGVNVTPGGVAKLKSRIAELNDLIKDAIKSSPATVDKAKVASYLQGTLKQFEQQVNPQADIRAIRQAWNAFVNHPILKDIENIPVKVAQDLKTGTYKSLGEKSYGELKSSAVEAQKTLARGLKEEIAKAVPEVSSLNAQESKLLNASNLAERRVLMASNRDIGGIGWMAHNPKTWLAFMADRSPLIKSLLARMMYSGAERVPQAVGMGLAAGAGGLMDSSQDNP